LVPDLASLRSGPLTVKIADNTKDVIAAQNLRYRAFYEEMDGRPSLSMARAQRDFDHFDDYADHLLIVDTAQNQSQIVGTYRLLRRAAAARAGGFYSLSEFDISALTSQSGKILELGRSCIATSHRNGRAIQLLWQAIAAYIFHYEIDILFGCASLPGINPNKHRLPLSYLHHFHRAPLCIRSIALPGRLVNMNRIPKDRISPRDGMRALPPPWLGGT